MQVIELFHPFIFGYFIRLFCITHYDLFRADPASRATVSGWRLRGRSRGRGGAAETAEIEEAEASTVAAAATTTSEGAAEAAAAVSGAEAAAAAAVSGAAAEEDLDEGAVVEALINFKIKGLQNVSSC